LAVYLRDHTLIKNQKCINKLTGKTIKAIVPVHVFGHPVDMTALQALCKTYHLKIIEDATESLGSTYRGQHTGHFGHTAVISFNGNKIITTGGGGAILTHDQALAKRAKHLTTTAKRPHAHEFYHDELGYNYRLPNLNAALGCAQLEQLPRFVKQKRKLAMDYIQAFESIQFARILKESPNTESNYWLNALVLNEPNRVLVEQFIQLAHERKWALRGLWTPLNRLPRYQDCPSMDLTQTDRLFDSVISLPSSAELGK
jgi:perosamine synthetase